MDFKIGDRVMLKNSKSNQIGQVIGILTDNVIYLNSLDETIIHATKGEYLVKFLFHETEDSFSYYSKSYLTKYE